MFDSGPYILITFDVSMISRTTPPETLERQSHKHMISFWQILVSTESRVQFGKNTSNFLRACQVSLVATAGRMGRKWITYVEHIRRPFAYLCQACQSCGRSTISSR